MCEKQFILTKITSGMGHALNMYLKPLQQLRNVHKGNKFHDPVVVIHIDLIHMGGVTQLVC